MKKILFIFSILLFSISYLTAGNISIAGFLFYPDKSPVSDGTVKLFSTEVLYYPVSITKTDENGQYELTGVEEGKYIIEV